MIEQNLPQAELFQTIKNSLDEGNSTLINVGSFGTDQVFSYTVGGACFGEADFIIIGLQAEVCEALLPVVANIYKERGAGTYVDIFENDTGINVTLLEIPHDLDVLVNEYATQTYTFYNQYKPALLENNRMVQVIWYDDDMQMGCEPLYKGVDND